MTRTNCPFVITADDYGLSCSVNVGIEQLARYGAVDAVSVMCHADAALDSVSELRTCGVATGVHLVLVEERPLCPEAVGPLLDAYGRLPSGYDALFATLTGRPWLVRSLVREAWAQLEKYQGLGLPLNFINSHQHVHLFPPLWAALAPIFEHFAESRVRTARWSWSGGSPQRLLGIAAEVSLRLHRLPPERISVAVGVDFAGRATLARCRELIMTLARSPRSGDLFELVMHPGLPDHGTLNRYCSWNYHWRDEYELLASQALRDLMLDCGFTSEEG